MSGDAEWVAAPIVPPGDMGQGGGNDDGNEEGGGQGFIDSPDGGGVGTECDIWAQDCPDGEKCMPWSNDGSGEWNATRCSPVADMPGSAGGACMVEGGPASGIDDCNERSMCWDVDRNNDGTCIGFCLGEQDQPYCPGDQWCFIGYEGAISVCMPAALCVPDGVCQCICPESADPDCEPEQCNPPEAASTPDELTATPPITTDEEPAQCPDSRDPVVLYMSNDDSNSQASPALARRMIAEGRVVSADQIRIHEFLNYYDLAGPSSQDAGATVGIQMRRTDAEKGEFTLVLQAQGRQLSAEQRPPLNLVFSLDTSGSMDGEPLDLLKETMFAAAGELRDGDVVSVVTWADEQSIELDGYGVTGPDDPELMSVINGLQAGGSTDLHGGLVKAYALANAYHVDDGINRVVLVSDGGANAGVTDLDLIASEASDADGNGTYMVGVGVTGNSLNYRDTLMDEVTDAGKGAYIFVDRSKEAQVQLGDRFLSNVAVSARNVRMQLTLPWYFGIKRFHGEEYSADPSEVEPQHLAPNDAMTFHQIVSACDADLIMTCDAITASVEYTDPLTGSLERDTITASVESLVQQEVPQLRKADVVVGYAKALIVIDSLMSNDMRTEAVAVANNMQSWASSAATHLSDPELQGIADLLGQYALSL